MPKNKSHYVYCRKYKHYLTGKIMRASKYGYRAWKILIKKKVKTF